MNLDPVKLLTLAITLTSASFASDTSVKIRCQKGSLGGSGPRFAAKRTLDPIDLIQEVYWGKGKSEGLSWSGNMGEREGQREKDWETK